jgi:hypothetical protein
MWVSLMDLRYVGFLKEIKVWIFPKDVCLLLLLFVASEYKKGKLKNGLRRVL